MSYYQQNPYLNSGNSNRENLQFYASPGLGASPQFVGGNMSPSVAGADLAGSLGDQHLSTGLLAAFSSSGYTGEPPLLEELGINFQHIKFKTLAVLNPRARVTSDIMTDSDLAGPILFCLLFGTLLLLSGKAHFGYIYGVALFGTVSLHYLFKLMATQGATIDLVRTASVIGYCLLPLVLLSVFAVFFSLDNMIGYLGSLVAVLWCTYSASGFFVAVLQLSNVRFLIGYPLAMFYSVFALMAIFVEKSV